MTNVRAFACAAALLALGAIACHRAAAAPPRVWRTMVHCPAGNQDSAHVTPPRDSIAVGDSIIWRTNGRPTTALAIALKNANQAWPFTGALPSGADSANTGHAVTPGRYPYQVTVTCRMPGNRDSLVVIDPDIIIY